MTRRFASTLFAVALAASTLFAGPGSAHAGLMTSTDALAQAEIFATDPMFQSVGYVSGFDNLGEFFAGSGVLIDPHWVLTAGHVLLDGGTTPHDGIGFSLNNNFFDVPTNLIMSDAFFPFPGYSEDTPPGQGNDIGLIRLVDPIFDVIPAERFYGVDQPGTHVYTAGFGSPGVWPNTDPFDGVLRAGENVADCIGCLVAVNDNYWLSSFDRFSPLPLEWQGTGGDSGGPWFAELDGRTQLVGLTAFGRGSNTTTGATRVSLYNDWIDETIAANGGSTAVPEPSSIVLFTMGMLGLGCSRFRRKPTSA